MDEIYAYVANLGFPIVVSVYLLVRIEAKLEKLSASIHELAQVISACNLTPSKKI
ncbi:MAG TPA: YvrJ family protein [Clostridiales bacterium]|nr:YvrJ family protein [Clostridiales bacterium]